MHALTARAPWVRYAMVQHRFAKWTLPLLLPKRWVDWLMASALGLLPKKGPAAAPCLAQNGHAKGA